MPDAQRGPVHPLTDLSAALGFLTVLPVGREWSEDHPPRPVPWYPWVGWLLGAVVLIPLYAHVHYRGGIVGMAALLAAAVIVAMWGALTRLLHWDGVADAFDGILGGSTPARRLEIMRDSRVGAFGVTAITLTVFLQVSAISVAIERGSLWVLLAAPVLGRLAASMAAWSLPSARPDGLGNSARRSPGFYGWIVAGAAFGCLAVLLVLGASPLSWSITMGAGLLAAVALPRILARPVGGMTGDLLGATVLLTELCVLIAGAVT